MIHRSPLPPVPVPECSLPDHVLARDRGDKVAVLDGMTGARITYAELASQVALVAGGVRAAGFRPGDVVALRMQNGPRFPVAVHGVMAAGVAVALLNPNLTPVETQRLLDLSGATLLDEFSQAELPPVAATLPFFHIYGFSIILNSGLLRGATLVTLPRVNIDVYLETLESHHVTRAYLVPVHREARVVEPGTDEDADVGELLVRGPQVSADGWLRTGDLVSVDEHSRFYVHDEIPRSVSGKILRRLLKERACVS